MKKEQFKDFIKKSKDQIRGMEFIVEGYYTPNLNIPGEYEFNRRTISSLRLLGEWVLGLSNEYTFNIIKALTNNGWVDISENNNLINVINNCEGVKSIQIRVIKQVII